MTTEQIMALDAQYHMKTFKRFPIALERGEGCTLYDKNGKAYLDFLAGIAVCTLGYNHKAFIKAVEEQLHRLIHCSNLFYIEPQVILSQMLIENSCADRVFFCNSGAEANEGALKLIRKYFYMKNPKQDTIITMENSFHGRTIATVTATGQPKYQDQFPPLPGGFIHVPYNDISALQSAITEHTAAIMLEVIQGEGGVIPLKPGLLKQIRALCDTHGILLMIDEVQTGVGRTGKLFAHQHEDVAPDIFTIAKALGNGLPIGALLAKEHVADAFSPGDHGSTFGGNPLCCAGAIAVMKEIQNGLITHCALMGDYFMNQLIKLQQKYPFITHVRGKGLLIGVELNPSVSCNDIIVKAQDKGFIFNSAGKNTLRFAPPLIINEQQIDTLISALDDIFVTINH